MRLAVMLVFVGLVSAPVGAAATPTESKQWTGNHKLSWQDRRFMRQAAQAGLFDGHNPAVRAYAARTLPVLRMHLRMARHTLHQLDCC
jgi:hypothetical protein